MPQFGLPCAVRATSLTNPTDVHTFKSLSEAQAYIEKETGNRPHHSVIKKRAQNNKDGFGFRWELVDKNTPQTEPQDEDTSFDDVPDTNIFTFRECVESIFNGGKVRVTDETPKRVSVIDIIRIVSSNTQYPQKVWQRIQENTEHAEVVTKSRNFKFPGAGQRDTPVTDAEGMMLLVNMLPGRKAQQFRASGMRMLMRVLVGDQSVHEELDDNAGRQERLHPDHPLQLISDEVYSHPNSNKYVMLSPTMKGKYIGMFYSRPVVYILLFTFNGKEYIKIGWSDEFRGRMDDHYRELPGCRIYAVFPVDNACRVEQSWKNDFRAYCSPQLVKGKKKTELYIGIELEEAENRLLELCNEQVSVYKRDYELEMMQLRMKHELAMKDKELESQRLQLQILQAQIALKSQQVN